MSTGFWEEQALEQDLSSYHALTSPLPAIPIIPPAAQRIRSGSISGRLRSASELEEKGLIDRMQKGVLKNLIMSGDEHLLPVLDKFREEGDTSELRSLLKSGVLEGRPSLDLELLMDDLDMNFLQLSSGVMGMGGALGGDGEHCQFDMDDMASLIAGDQAGQGSVGAGSFMEEELLSSMVGVLGRSMSPSHSASFGLSPFAEESGSGGLPAFLVAVKDEAPPTLAGEGGKGAPVMRGKAAAASGATRNNKPPSGPPSASAASSTLQQASLLVGVPPPRGSRRGSHPGSRPSAAAAAASVGAALASKTGGPGASKAESQADSSPSARSKSNGRASPAVSALASDALEPQSQPGAINPSEASEKAAAAAAASSLMPVLQGNSPHSSPTGSINISTGAGGAEEKRDANKHYIGAYSPESRRLRLEKFWEKKKNRIWDRKVKYDVRKNFADSRVRVKGRFVKKEDEAILIEVNTLTSREGAMTPGGGQENSSCLASGTAPSDSLATEGLHMGVGEGAILPGRGRKGSSSDLLPGLLLGKDELVLGGHEEDGIAVGVEELEDLLAPLDGL